MGAEVVAMVRVGGRRAECRVLLETREIIVRGELARKFPFEAIDGLAAREGWLEFESGGVPAGIELGAKAAEWLEAIRNPRTRIQKLGVDVGMKVCVLGRAEGDAVAELSACLGSAPARRLGKDVDVVLLFAAEREELARLGEIEPALAAGGAVWVLWPKGRKDFAHEDVVAGAKRAGLTQTRSMGFSGVLTGLRLVRPAAKRVRA